MKLVRWIFRRLRPRRSGRGKFYDVMPPALARKLVQTDIDQCQKVFSLYLRGEFPRLDNKEFEQRLHDFSEWTRRFEAQIPSRRKGGRPGQQNRLLEELPKLPQGTSNKMAAAKLGVDVRAIETAKQTLRTQQAQKKSSAIYLHVHEGFDGKG